MIRYLAFAFLFAGCASRGSQLNRLNLGMGKSQVIGVMGDPDSVKATEGREVLVYTVSEWSMEAWHNSGGEYWVVLEEGKVTKYGKAGDIGALPARRYVIENR